MKHPNTGRGLTPSHGEAGESRTPWEPRCTEVRAASGFLGSEEWGNTTRSSAKRTDTDKQMPPESGTPEGNRLLPTISHGCSSYHPMVNALATRVGTVES